MPISLAFWETRGSPYHCDSGCKFSTWKWSEGLELMYSWPKSVETEGPLQYLFRVGFALFEGRDYNKKIICDCFPLHLVSCIWIWLLGWNRVVPLRLLYCVWEGVDLNLHVTQTGIEFLLHSAGKRLRNCARDSKSSLNHVLFWIWNLSFLKNVLYKIMFK